MKRYKQVPHTADLAAIIYGRDITELFENAAYAMFDMMGDLRGLTPEEKKPIEVEAPDTESLLVAWLNELLYVFHSKGILFSEFKVFSVKNNALMAEAKGQKLAKDARRLRSEIKAATYHDLKIEKVGSVYEVTVVFDI